MIPPDIRQFIGRDEELAALATWLATSRATPLFVLGTGGIGKTTLVTHFVCKHFTGGRVAWLSVNTTSNPLAALDSFLEEVEATHPAVVVLDDIEQLPRPAIEGFVSRLRARLPEVSIIVTSRHAVGLLDSTTLPLGPFTREEALAFLKSRVASTSSESELALLASILDNTPLALELVAAAARTRELPVSYLISRLQAKIYDLGQQIQKPTETLVQVVQPKIITATNSLIEQLKKRPEDLYTISPRSFEEMIASLLEDMGWEVHLTQQTRDGGRDMLAYLRTEIGRLLCLVEAKKYNPQRPVGVELVRNLFGTLCHEQANSAILVTTSHFTADAREFQQRHVFQIGLKEYEDVVEWITKYKTKPD